MSDGVTTYVCRTCEQELPYHAFYSYDTTRCKDCKVAWSSSYGDRVTRRCSVCGEDKPYAAFPQKMRRKDRTDRVCRECREKERDRARLEMQEAARAKREQAKQERLAKQREGNTEQNATSVDAAAKRRAFWQGHGRPVSTERARSRKTRLRKMKAIVLYLQTHPCVDCGETDPLVLDFHHRDPSTKLFTVRDKGLHTSVQRLEAEIRKCEVLCANCHRKRTAAEDQRRQMPIAIKEVEEGLLDDVYVIKDETVPPPPSSPFVPPPGLFD